MSLQREWYDKSQMVFHSETMSEQPKFSLYKELEKTN